MTCYQALTSSSACKLGLHRVLVREESSTRVSCLQIILVLLAGPNLTSSSSSYTGWVGYKTLPFFLQAHCLNANQSTPITYLYSSICYCSAWTDAARPLRKVVIQLSSATFRADRCTYDLYLRRSFRDAFDKYKRMNGLAEEQEEAQVDER